MLKDVKGEAVMQVQAGELRGRRSPGAVEIESNGTRLTLEESHGHAAADSYQRHRRQRQARAASAAKPAIDGRDTRIDVTIDRPAPIAIYNEAEEPMDVTLPAGGFQLDALATDGRLSVPDGLPEVKTTDNEQRATGADRRRRSDVITLRASRRQHLTIKTQVGSADAK